MANWAYNYSCYATTPPGSGSIDISSYFPEGGTLSELDSDSQLLPGDTLVDEYGIIYAFEGTTSAGDLVASWYPMPSTQETVILRQAGTFTAYAGPVAYTAGTLAICFLRGTLILTARGEVKVERLGAGDLVATKFGGLRPVRWMGTQRFEGRLAGKGHQPIRFVAGSLGQGVPSCDLFVSPGHAMLIPGGDGGELLAHAGALVNGETITQERVRGEIEYFHIDLGPHDCVLASGAWAESYFEDRNRDAFHNAAEFHALNPGHAAERQATCLPIVTAEHPGIDGVRRVLAPRAVRRAA
jgi:hypothetical protein